MDRYFIQDTIEILVDRGTIMHDFAVASKHDYCTTRFVNKKNVRLRKCNSDVYAFINVGWV